MRTKIANHRAAVAARLAADDEWSKAGEPDNGPEWEAHNLAIARGFETFRELFETFPTTAIGTAALLERPAQPLYDDDDFTVLEPAVELWKGWVRTMGWSDPGKGGLLAQTIDVYSNEFPDELYWSISAQAALLLANLMMEIDSSCRPEAQSKPRPAIRLVDRKPRDKE